MAILIIMAINCSEENGLKYGQIVCLLQQNQNYNKLVKTEIKKSIFEGSYDQNQLLSQKFTILGHFSFIN